MIEDGTPEGYQQPTRNWQKSGSWADTFAESLARRDADSILVSTPNIYNQTLDSDYRSFVDFLQRKKGETATAADSNSAKYDLLDINNALQYATILYCGRHLVTFGKEWTSFEERASDVTYDYSTNEFVENYRRHSIFKGADIRSLFIPAASADISTIFGRLPVNLSMDDIDRLASYKAKNPRTEQYFNNYKDHLTWLLQRGVDRRSLDTGRDAAGLHGEQLLPESINELSTMIRNVQINFAEKLIYLMDDIPFKNPPDIAESTVASPDKPVQHIEGIGEILNIYENDNRGRIRVTLNYRNQLMRIINSNFALNPDKSSLSLLLSIDPDITKLTKLASALLTPQDEIDIFKKLVGATRFSDLEPENIANCRIPTQNQYLTPDLSRDFWTKTYEQVRRVYGLPSTSPDKDRRNVDRLFAIMQLLPRTFSDRNKHPTHLSLMLGQRNLDLLDVPFEEGDDPIYLLNVMRGIKRLNGEERRVDLSWSNYIKGDGITKIVKAVNYISKYISFPGAARNYTESFYLRGTQRNPVRDREALKADNTDITDAISYLFNPSDRSAIRDTSLAFLMETDRATESILSLIQALSNNEKTDDAIALINEVSTKGFPRMGIFLDLSFNNYPISETGVPKNWNSLNYAERRLVVARNLFSRVIFAGVQPHHNGFTVTDAAVSGEDLRQMYHNPHNENNEFIPRINRSTLPAGVNIRHGIPRQFTDLCIEGLGYHQQAEDTQYDVVQKDIIRRLGNLYLEEAFALSLPNNATSTFNSKFLIAGLLTGETTWDDVYTAHLVKVVEDYLQFQTQRHSHVLPANFSSEDLSRIANQIVLKTRVIVPIDKWSTITGREIPHNGNMENIAVLLTDVDRAAYALGSGPNVYLGKEHLLKEKLIQQTISPNIKAIQSNDPVDRASIARGFIQSRDAIAAEQQITPTLARLSGMTPQELLYTLLLSPTERKFNLAATFAVTAYKGRESNFAAARRRNLSQVQIAQGPVRNLTAALGGIPGAVFWGFVKHLTPTSINKLRAVPFLGGAQLAESLIRIESQSPNTDQLATSVGQLPDWDRYVTGIVPMQDKLEIPTSLINHIKDIPILDRLTVAFPWLDHIQNIPVELPTQFLLGTNIDFPAWLSSPIFIAPLAWGIYRGTMDSIHHLHNTGKKEFEKKQDLYGGMLYRELFSSLQGWEDVLNTHINTIDSQYNRETREANMAQVQNAYRAEYNNLPFRDRLAYLHSRMNERRSNNPMLQQVRHLGLRNRIATILTNRFSPTRFINYSRRAERHYDRTGQRADYDYRLNNIIQSENTNNSHHDTIISDTQRGEMAREQLIARFNDTFRNLSFGTKVVYFGSDTRQGVRVRNLSNPLRETMRRRGITNRLAYFMATKMPGTRLIDPLRWAQGYYNFVGLDKPE